MRVAALSSHSPRGPRRRLGVRSPRRRLATVIGIAGLLAGLLPAAGAGPAVASHTPGPTSVTIAGSLQSEMGCASDWNPACNASGLTLDPGDGVWQGTFAAARPGRGSTRPPLNDALGRELRRRTRSPDGANIPLTPRRGPDRQVLLRPRQRTGSRTTSSSVDRGRARQLPVRARLRRRLGPGLPALVAPGRRRRRHLHPRRPRDRRPAAYEAQGRDQRGVGRELRRRAACPGGANIAVHRPGRRAPRSCSATSRRRHVLTITCRPRPRRQRRVGRPAPRLAGRPATGRPAARSPAGHARSTSASGRSTTT